MQRLVELEHALEWRPAGERPCNDDDVIVVLRGVTGDEWYEIGFWTGTSWCIATEVDSEVIGWRQIVGDFWDYDPEKN